MTTTEIILCIVAVELLTLKIVLVAGFTAFIAFRRYSAPVVLARLASDLGDTQHLDTIPIPGDRHPNSTTSDLSTHPPSTRDTLPSFDLTIDDAPRTMAELIRDRDSALERLAQAHRRA